MIKFFFKPYSISHVANYKHHGVGYTGYTGIDQELYYPGSARLYHCGIGYTGIK